MPALIVVSGVCHNFCSTRYHVALASWRLDPPSSTNAKDDPLIQLMRAAIVSFASLESLTYQQRHGYIYDVPRNVIQNI